MSARDKQVGGTHYKTMKIQPTEFIMAVGLNWCEGNAVKYICRHHFKGGRVDIEKAIHYLELLLEEEYGQDGQQASNQPIASLGGIAALPQVYVEPQRGGIIPLAAPPGFDGGLSERSKGWWVCDNGGSK